MHELTSSSKGALFQGMMRHPESSKLIKEAFSSPLGSTSRAKAQKSFSIMSKLHAANYGTNDGAGGPGMMPEQQGGFDQVPESTPSTPKNMVIFNRIPVPKITYGKARPVAPVTAPVAAPVAPSFPKAYDGAGGGGVHDGKGGLIGDFGNMISNFAKPFTDYITHPSVITYDSQTQGPSASSNSNNATLNLNPANPAAALSLNNPVNNGIASGMKLPVGNSAPISLTNTQTGAKAVVQPNVTSRVPAAINNPLASLQSPVPSSKLTIPANFSSPIKTLTPAITPPISDAAKTAYSKTIDVKSPTLTYTGTKEVPNPLTGFGQPKTITVPTSRTIDNPFYGMKAAVVPPPPTYGPQQPSDFSTLGTTPTETQSGSGAPSFYQTLSGAISSIPSTIQNTYSGITKGVTDAGSGAGNAYSGGASNVSNTGSSSGTGLDAFTAGLVSTESGGNYQAIGKVISSGENAGYAALGKYQIMPNLHFATIGLDANNEADVQKFLNTPELQDTLYAKIIADLSSQYGGDMGKVAAAYFGGARAAQDYGTSAGDSWGDGNLSINQYVNSVLGRNASSAVASGMSSPLTFAYDQIRKEKGMGLAEAEAENKRTIWADLGLDTSKVAIEKMQQEFAALPKDMTDYITARDTYIKDTDKAIADYMADIAKKDMSNPADVRKAQSHLNYLYTLRGRQNQTYMGYLNDAVTNHETKLNNMITDYNSKLAIGEERLASENAIDREEYNNMLTSYSELYSSIKAAPLEALQMQAYKTQVLGAAGTGVADQVKYDEQVGYMKQRDKLKGQILQDSNLLLAKPGVELVNTIINNSSPGGDPSIFPRNQVRAYADGVHNYMVQPVEKDNVTGSGVTSAGKQTLAEEAIRNFAQTAQYGIETGNADVANLSLEQANIVSNDLTNHMGGVLTRITPQLMESIKTLAPKGWFGGAKTPPTLQEFTNTVKKSTNGDALADSMAKAIYAVFLQYTSTGSSPQSFIDTALNQTGSTEDRASLKPYTTDEMAKIFGKMYANDVFFSEFSAYEGARQMIEEQMLSQQ